MSLSSHSATSLPNAWGEFPNTVLHFGGDLPCAIDLREPVTPAHRDHFARLGLEQTFGVLSAQDPWGKTLSPQQNHELAVKLHHELAVAGIPYVPLDACSPDHSHCETSVAVSLSQADAVALAVRHEQLAIFWFDGARFWIVPAVSMTPAIPLPIRVISTIFTT